MSPRQNRCRQLMRCSSVSEVGAAFRGRLISSQPDLSYCTLQEHKCTLSKHTCGQLLLASAAISQGAVTDLQNTLTSNSAVQLLGWRTVFQSLVQAGDDGSAILGICNRMEVEELVSSMQCTELPVVAASYSMMRATDVELPDRLFNVRQLFSRLSLAQVWHARILDCPFLSTLLHSDHFEFSLFFASNVCILAEILCCIQYSVLCFVCSWKAKSYLARFPVRSCLASSSTHIG